MTPAPLAPKDNEAPGRTSTDVSPAPEEVRAELVKVQNSDPFVRSDRIKKLLAFLVDSVLAGNPDILKESLIGVEVFDRPPAYDSKLDPVVRVEMRRLRSKLSEYYLGEGKSDDVRIWLEKGSYIPTLSKRVAEVSVPPPPRQPVPPAEPPPAVPPRRSRIFWIAGTSAILLIAVALGVYFGRSRPSQPLRVFPLAGNAGLEASPAFSPDSRQVAYSWDGNRRNFDIYVKQIEGGIPHRLTDNAAHDIDPSWSPDGQQIAFLRVFPDKTQLITIPSVGGVEKVVANLASSVNRWHPEEPEQIGAGGPVWSPDGSYLVVTGPPPSHSSGPSKINPFALLKIDMNGHVVTLDFPPLEIGDITPRISPSGQFVAFTRTWRITSGDIHIVASRGGQPVRLTFDSRNVQGLAWLDDRNIIFSSNRGGSLRLWQVARTGGSPQPFFTGGGQPTWPAVSPNGHWIAFVETVNGASIWRLSLSAQGRASQPESFITSASDDTSPAYSPDGKKVAFVSHRTGSAQVWVADSDGMDVRQLTNFEGSSVGAPRWSPDSRRLAFDGVLKDLSSIWLINADGSNLHRLNNISVKEYGPTWSRDGQWIYFCSLRSGKDQIWKQAPDSGQSVRLTDLTFVDAVESSDGQTLYLQRARGGLWQMPIKGGTAEPIPELASSYLGRYWALVGDTVYYVNQGELVHKLKSFNLTTRKSQEIAVIPNQMLAGTPGMAVDPGGNWLLFVQRSQHRSTIMLAER